MVSLEIDVATVFLFVCQCALTRAFTFNPPFKIQANCKSFIVL